MIAYWVPHGSTYAADIDNVIILVGVIVIFQGVPAWMASIHQVVGMITLALAVSIYHQTRAVSP